MKLIKISVTIALLIAPALMFAQSRQVTGKVTDAQTGEPLPFAAVIVQGTSTAATTDLDGNYSIKAAGDADLFFSLLGYQETTVPVNNRDVINVQLAVDSNLLEESVVSALGITRAAKSLTYASQTVDANSLAANKSANMINSPTGKAAGVSITSNASGMGGSAKISIRGFRSVSGGNQPLIVVNGVPMSNSSTTDSGFYGGSSQQSVDEGDGLGNINPDDIESISILKGASASALYGTEAANGVILITTKSGAKDRIHVTYNNTTTFDVVAYGPKMQHTYGESTNYYSWGDKLSSPAEIISDNFYKSALTETNSISLQGGNEKNQTYLSYANTYANSILDNNGSLQRNNITFRNTTTFNEKLSLDVSVQLIAQHVKNRPSMSGQYNNPMFGVYHWPVGRDFTEYRDNFEVYNADRNLMAQNWIKEVNANSDQNPWWLMNRVNYENWRQRAIASATLRYDITPKVYLQGRAGTDYYVDRKDNKTSATAPEGLTMSENGRYAIGKYSNMTSYADFLAGYKDNWGKFGLNLTIGSSIKYSESDGIGLDSWRNAGGMYYANIFTMNNMKLRAGDQQWYRNSLVGLFGTATLSYDEWLYLDITARNDWSSTLAYTNSFKKGFFYPSVGLSAVLNDAFEMPSWIDLAKVRASYAVVGNALPSRITNPLGSLNAEGIISSNTTAPFGELKPELSGSMEFGIDFRVLKNRIGLDLTFYKTNTRNQLFTLAAPAGSGYNRYYVNSGNIQNMGLEGTLSFVPVETKLVKWTSAFNFSTNKNVVKELNDEIEQFVINSGVNFGYELRLVPGGSYGDLYGRKFARDEQGELLLDEEGLPYQESAAFQLLGNTQAKFNLGWNNSVEIGDFALSFLIDARFGGIMMGLTQADIDIYGTSQDTADARDKGYVEYEGKQFKNVQAFYNRVGGFGGINEYYTYDATNIRLRELSVGYNIPSKLLAKQKFIKGVTVSAVGRNLCFLYKKAPFDPDVMINTGDNYSGLEIYGTPGTRNFGFNVKVSF